MIDDKQAAILRANGFEVGNEHFANFEGEVGIELMLPPYEAEYWVTITLPNGKTLQCSIDPEQVLEWADPAEQREREREERS